jgi:hypothetical protein
LVVLGGVSAAGPFRIKASPVVAPCVEAAARAYRQTSGRIVEVHTEAIERRDAGDGFDVVVGADEELTRVIEGGSSHPDRDVDVARIPWVLLTPSPGAGGAALSKSGAPVRVIDGPVGLEARAWLRRTGRLAASEALAREGARSLAPGESALVPVSLAGGVLGVAVDVPPVVARAVGMRASAQPAVVVEFLAFLETGPGSTAFGACGRGVTK